MFIVKHPVRESGIRIESRYLSWVFLLAGLLLLMMAAAPSVQAKEGHRCVPHYGSGWHYWLADSGYMRGIQPMYRSSECEPPSRAKFDWGTYGSTIAGSRASAIAICIKYTGISNMEARPGGGLWQCKPIFDSKVKSGSSAKSYGSSSSRSVFYVKPEIHTSKLPLGTVMVNAELGLNSGIQFQRFDHYAVGVQSVADRGILDVVDVWGQANQKYEVCFPQAGAIVFLDASTSPRSVVNVDSFTRDGYTCGSMNRAGTMVLVKGSSSTPASSSNALARGFINSTNDDVNTAIDLENCTVSSPHTLNIRIDPWGAVLSVLPKHTSVSAFARTESWYRVRYTTTQSEGDEGEVVKVGWIAAWLSKSDGDCEWESDEGSSRAMASSDIGLDDVVSVASLARGLSL